MASRARGLPSLARRLVLLALGWSLAALTIAGAVLALLFQEAAIRRLDGSLGDLTVNLVTYSTVDDGFKAKCRIPGTFCEFIWVEPKRLACGTFFTIVSSAAFSADDTILTRTLVAGRHFRN